MPPNSMKTNYTGMWYSKCTNKKVVPCTQHSMFWGLTDSYPHGDSNKNMCFLAPVYHRPPFAAACGGADNDGAPIVATSFESYLPSKHHHPAQEHRQRLCGDVWHPGYCC